MQPNQNTQNGNPYEFIVNPNKPQKKGLLPTGYSKNQRILFVVVGLVIIVLCIMLISSLLGSGSKSNKDQLVGVIKQQRELIRVADIGVKKAQRSDAQNLAITTKLALSSEQAALESAAKSLGVKVSSKTSGKNTKTDELLMKAEQANNFDAVFIKELQTELTAYAKAVQTAYKNNNGTKTKKALEAQFNNAALLANFKE